MVCMVIEGVRSILSQVDLINDKWNDEIILTKKKVKTILEDIKDLEVSF